jgi:chromosome segregation protein
VVYIKRVELSHFKSFGGTNSIPLLPGFTVVSGPNGSGKSNILDGLLFCLGLSSSKGMRADRLPDLVNHNHSQKNTSEAIVTVTFDLEDQVFIDENSGEEVKEWSVTRKLRVTASGSYTSNYYINGQSCTLTDLHERLNKLRIYPEGYNVVLQGDVTSIITMNSKERREIIDELAGVASFDRKIIQTKDTLANVKEREDSCRIIEAELLAQLERLSQDKIKAEKYSLLRTELLEKEGGELVLKWRSLLQKQEILNQNLTNGDRDYQSLSERLSEVNQESIKLTIELEQLNTLVKSLGEDELIAFQSNLAGQQAELRQLQQQQQELNSATEDREAKINQCQTDLRQNTTNLTTIVENLQRVNLQLTEKNQQKTSLQQRLLENREQGQAIASASELWVQQQTNLTKQIESLLKTIEPQRTEQAQLQERDSQLQKQIAQQTENLQQVSEELNLKDAELKTLNIAYHNSEEPIQQLERVLKLEERELNLQLDTQKRLLNEQREKQRLLDKLETQTQVQQENSGTFATKVIIESGLTGICGLVCQLGKVDPRYQLALEIAAGARLGNLVVDDDAVAAAAIQLLKQKKAGRLTFLPLNKIKETKLNQTTALRYSQGFIEYAVNLIECEPYYKKIFAYVFGNTVVFDNVENGRSQLGQYRIVTLDGELLETSGAMTGGSMSNRSSSLHFNTMDMTDSTEMKQLQQRLNEIEKILEHCQNIIDDKNREIRIRTQELTESKQQRREQQINLEQLQKDVKSLTAQKQQITNLIENYQLELNTVQTNLYNINSELPAKQEQLQTLRVELNELEKNQTNAEWQKINNLVKQLETELNQQEIALSNLEQQKQNYTNEQQKLQIKINDLEERLQIYNNDSHKYQEQLQKITQKIAQNQQEIHENQQKIQQVEQRLGENKQKRDRTEQKLKQSDREKQQIEWKIEKLTENLEQWRTELAELLPQIEAQQRELPDPLPEVPLLVKKDNENIGENITFDNYQEQLEHLQKQIKNLQKRMQSLEPVNMLALEEYAKTQTRLDDLTGKLSTLEAERTELLLRIENFTTLRQNAFMEAFDAVNENFETIFAELSEGDGHLQLENPEDPFAGGLNLVAHPKGKPVQRLASMSGGEKSLTALSFIFALQRYRPSPFYAFDEVDMFLDGANVERLAKMIKKQAQQAQFIVVSLRRPMIASSQRTIGVTQARGAYTQVLGMKLEQ